MVSKIGGATVAGVALPSLSAACNIDSGGSDNSIQGSAGRVLGSEAPLPEAFRAHLPIPPVLEPVHRDGSADHYEVTQKIGPVEILAGFHLTHDDNENSRASRVVTGISR